MSYIKNEVKQILATEVMGFRMEADKTSSNRTTTMSIINPDYNIEIADSEQRLTVSLFDYLTANNGVMPTDL
jgi:hypothetical protein